MRRTMIALTLCLLSGCTYYYYESNLNRLSPGISEEQFLAAYPTKHGVNTTAGAAIRASKTIDGKRLDVVTLPLALNGIDHSTEYWFIFRDGKLVQWGKPEDWRSVSATYQIDFNPSPSVRPPN